MFNRIASKFQRLWAKFHIKAYRDAFVASHLRTTVAAQVAVIREDCGWTQKQLADAMGTSQSQVSCIESPNYDKMTLSTLKKVASALDVAVIVRFVPFSDLLRWSCAVEAGKFAVPSFRKDDPPEAGSPGAISAARDNLRRHLADLDLPLPRPAMLIALTPLQAAISVPVFQ